MKLIMGSTFLAGFGNVFVVVDLVHADSMFLLLLLLLLLPN